MCGMREVIRSVDTDVPARLSKCVIVALNIQEIPVKDGPDEKIYSILKKAKEKNIPIIHSCTRRILGINQISFVLFIRLRLYWQSVCKNEYNKHY